MIRPRVTVPPVTGSRHLPIRLDEARRARWQIAARDRGTSLASLIRDSVDRVLTLAQTLERSGRESQGALGSLVELARSVTGLADDFGPRCPTCDQPLLRHPGASEGP